MKNIYSDIARRTGGNIYIGVVGPVRTGKSTLIKRLMEELVIPGIEDPQQRARARDELPQSGSGKTITTSEPKFIPEEAVMICPDGSARMKIRLIDSVGYMVNGAVGAEEDGKPRMVSTPWSAEPIPLTQAAEMGTKRVMEEHASIGIVVTTDGTITDIPRQDYVQAERTAIQDIQATGKPFLTIINTADPTGAAAYQLRESLKQEYGVEAAIADCKALDAEGITALLQDLLFSFPMTRMEVMLPGWLEALDPGLGVREQLNQALLRCAENIHTLGQAEDALEAVRSLETVEEAQLSDIDLATGCIRVHIKLPQVLYYETLSQAAGCEIHNDRQLLAVLKKLSATDRAYAGIADALQAVKSTGYGVVMPGPDALRLEQPELLKKGSSYGVRLKAGATAIHMMRLDIDTEVCPIVGDEKHSSELLERLRSEDPQQLWQSNLFGKSLYELVQDGLTSKLLRTPEDVKERFRGSLQRIVNDGANGLICIIL